MTESFERQPIARWFMIAAIASVLFMALGCAVYVMHVTADPATLPLDQRAAYAAEPSWLTGLNAVAVWVGVIGALFLVMKRKLAETLLLVSFVATLLWLAGLLLVPTLRDALSTNDIAVAVIVTLITGTIYSFARHSRQRGWLH
jgi:magnesium-transporting ATPase (P-type)